MTSRDFCYWLQGYFEIENNQPRPEEFSATLNSEQIKMIRNHLAMVFKHEIDPSFGGPEKQVELAKAHEGFAEQIELLKNLSFRQHTDNLTVNC